MRIIDAARIMAAGYAPRGRLDVVETLDRDGVQAHFLRDGTLVVPGTNEPTDWLGFNLRALPRASQALASAIRAGASGARWHNGFLSHAEAVYAFAKPLRPVRMIGHSLGAASAQIAGASLGIPVIAFASPRTKHGARRFPNEGWVLNLNRRDDLVGWLPPGRLGFRHLGSVYGLRPACRNPGIDHSMDHYIRLLSHPVAGRRVPQVWPPRV